MSAPHPTIAFYFGDEEEEFSQFECTCVPRVGDKVKVDGFSTEPDAPEGEILERRGVVVKVVWSFWLYKAGNPEQRWAAVYLEESLP